LTTARGSVSSPGGGGKGLKIHKAQVSVRLKDEKGGPPLRKKPPKKPGKKFKKKRSVFSTGKKVFWIKLKGGGKKEKGSGKGNIVRREPKRRCRGEGSYSHGRRGLPSP